MAAHAVNLWVVVNPTAGRGRTARIWPELRQLLPAGSTVILTKAPGHASEVAAEAARQGADVVLSVGGDGTAAEVATGLLGTGVPMAVIPTGAGCDIVRALGLPNNPRMVLERFLAGRLHVAAIDVGLINGRLFLTVAGVGFDAEVAQEDARTRRPGVHGTWPYLLAILRVLFRYRPTPLSLRIDDTEQCGRYLMVAICNTQHYAGGMRIAPTASPNDGLLDVVTVGDLSLLETLAALPRVYQGTHRTHPDIHFYRGRKVTIEAPEPLVAHAGGEIVGTTPLTVEVRPVALHLYVDRLIEPLPLVAVQDSRTERGTP